MLGMSIALLLKRQPYKIITDKIYIPNSFKVIEYFNEHANVEVAEQAMDDICAAK